MIDEPHDAEFTLAMPFVICASNGGPHDDAAFVSGYRLGELDAKLAVASALGLPPPTCVYRSDEQAQFDLIAMKHRYVIVDQDTTEDGEWTTAQIGWAS